MIADAIIWSVLYIIVDSGLLPEMITRVTIRISKDYGSKGRSEDSLIGTENGSWVPMC